MHVIRDPAILAGYLGDASNLPGGHCEGLVRPRSAEECAEVMAHCQANGIPLTVTARRTSTTGGPIPYGGWLLSTELLNTVLAIGRDTALVQAGVLLGEFQDQVEATGRLFPPDPTSRNECSLGGAIACNASGARSFKYGSIRPWVAAVQAVLPSGALIRATRDTPIPADWPSVDWTPPAVKSATGLSPEGNLLDLLIGSEGILGLVTEALVNLTDLPTHLFSVMAFFGSTDDALDFVDVAKGAGPRLIEYFDRHSLQLVRDRVPDVPDAAVAAVWIEQECTEADHEDQLMAWAERVESALEVLFAEEARDLERLRAIRHAIPAGVNEQVIANGMPKVGTDFAVPDAALRPMMAAYEAVDMPHVLFGHIGDNHLHLNLLPRSVSELDEARAIWSRLYDAALLHGGCLSAEHGVGKLKSKYLERMVGTATVTAFAALKRHLDPAWILGRGVMLDNGGAASPATR